MYYHTNDEGRTLTCDNPDACPFGAFDSPEAAQKSYEKRMADKTFISARRNTRQKDLNNIAKTSDNVEELHRAARFGSPRVLSNISLNPNADAETLSLALERPHDPRTEKNILRHPNYPPQLLSEEYLMVTPLYGKQKEALRLWAERDELTDKEAIHIAASSDRNAVYGIVGNPRNAVSPDTVNSIVAADFVEMYPAAKDNPKLSLDRIELGTHACREIGRTATNPKHLREAWDSVNARDPKDLYQWEDRSYILSNEHVPSDVVDEALSDDRVLEHEEIMKAVHNNRSTTHEQKMIALSHSPQLQSQEKVSRIEKDHGISYKDLVRHDASAWNSRSRNYVVDKEKAKEFGLTSTDIDFIVRERYHDYLWMHHYDERTGVYSGKID